MTQFSPQEHFRTQGEPQFAALAALRVPFDPAAVGRLPKRSKREDGTWGPTVYLDYVGHAAVTDRLLKVDPTWTWEPLALDQMGLPALDRDGNLWIRLTICGVTRLGVGDGKNMKERIGDAIRNAAMRFGVALDLWSKEDLHDMQEQREQHADRGGHTAADRAAHPAAQQTQAERPIPSHVRPVLLAIQELPEAEKARVREWYQGKGFPQPLDLSSEQAGQVLEFIYPTKAHPVDEALTGPVSVPDPR